MVFFLCGWLRGMRSVFYTANQHLLMLFTCQNPSDWFGLRIWMPSRGKLHFLSQVNSPIRHLTSEKAASDSVGEVGSSGPPELEYPASHWDGQCCLPASCQQRKQLGLKIRPSPARRPCWLHSSVTAAPWSQTPSQKWTWIPGWSIAQITINIQGQVPTIYYLLSSVSLLSSTQYIKTRTLS